MTPRPYTSTARQDATGQRDADGYSHVPFRVVGSVRVRYRKAVPLAPRVVTGEPGRLPEIVYTQVSPNT